MPSSAHKHSCEDARLSTKYKVRMDSQIYQDLLREHFLPWLRDNYNLGKYVFQQDIKIYAENLTFLYFVFTYELMRSS